MTSFTFKKFTRLTTIGTVILATTLLSAHASSSQKNDIPEVSEKGLTLVEKTKSSALYADPKADFSAFNRVSIADVEVAFRKNWLRDQNRDKMAMSHRVTQKDADRIKSLLAAEFTTVFTEELEKGGYDVVEYKGFENSAGDLLLLAPAIVNLDITAPDTMSAGMSRTYSASAGSMTLYMELNDSVSGALLAQVMDAESVRDTGYMSISNSVTNKADADRILRKWARLLVKKLDKVHGK